MMQIYLAPMEGITNYIYRQVFDELYGGIDKYFSPFLSPMQKRKLKSRDKKDVDPANNQGMALVPQVLTNHAEPFLETVEYLESLGYTEVNLNLGCPSPTVVTKGKGAGFLADPQELDQFFCEVFDRLVQKNSKVKITVKSRLGLYHPEEMIPLLEVYQTYPIAELILHPRVQKDMYKNPVDLELFAWVYEHCRLPLCYNGDLFSSEDFLNLRKRFPRLERFMLGRGLIANPGMLSVIRKTEAESDGHAPNTESLHHTDGLWSADQTADFFTYTDRLYRAYTEAFGNRKDAVYHMKEIWAFKEQFSQETDKQLRQIRKAKTPEQYERAVRDYFTE